MVVGDQTAPGLADPPVVPDAGADGKQPLGDPRAQAVEIFRDANLGQLRAVAHVDRAE